MLAALVVLAGLTAARAEEPVDWRSRALALNDITGDNPIRGEIKTLVSDPAQAKKLLAAALPLAKEKSQPFNYNAAFILARTALQLKDYEASLPFLRICAAEATRLQSFRKILPSVQDMLEVMDHLYTSKKYEETAKLCQEIIELMEVAGVREQFKDEVFRTLVQALVKQGKTDEAMQMVNNLVKARGSSWRALNLKAWLQRETGKKDEAAKTYLDVVPLITKDRELPPYRQASQQAEVHYRISRLYEDLKRQRDAEEQLQASATAYERALRLVKSDKELSDLGKDESAAQIHYLLSQTYTDLKQAEKAEDHLKASVRNYEEVLSQIDKTPDLDKEAKVEAATPIHYTLSSLYVDLRLIDKAAEHLQALLAVKPNDPTYNNDLGYIWADHDMNLDKAEAMIRKALEEDRKEKLKANPKSEVKENAAYLDSLGWVLFKKKKYQEARPVLEKAVQDKEGQHIEIFDHLGDVYMALGEKAKAVDAWKQGLKVAGSGKREQERKTQVEKKLQEVGETAKK